MLGRAPDDLGTRGVIVNMTSATAAINPPAPAGKGGWGVAYAASKAGVLADRGRAARRARSRRDPCVQRRSGPRRHRGPAGARWRQGVRGRRLPRDARRRCPGAVVAWLADADTEAVALSGATLGCGRGGEATGPGTRLAAPGRRTTRRRRTMTTTQSATPVIDATSTWRIVDERLATETDPHLRTALGHLREHMIGEATGDLPRVLATLTDDPAVPLLESPRATGARSRATRSWSTTPASSPPTPAASSSRWSTSSSIATASSTRATLRLIAPAAFWRERSYPGSTTATAGTSWPHA